MAIKIIHKNRIENKQDLARVRREIEFMSKLNHPHIVKILEGKLLIRNTKKNNLVCLSKLIQEKKASLINLMHKHKSPLYKMGGNFWCLYFFYQKFKKKGKLPLNKEPLIHRKKLPPQIKKNGIKFQN